MIVWQPPHFSDGALPNAVGIRFDFHPLAHHDRSMPYFLIVLNEPRLQIAGRESIAKLKQLPDMRERRHSDRRITIRGAHSGTRAYFVSGE